MGWQDAPLADAPASEPRKNWESAPVVGDDQKLQQRQSLVNAARTQPDQAAKTFELARRFSVPQDVAERNEPELVQRRMIEDAIVRLETGGSETLRRGYANGQFASMAIDDMGALFGVDAQIAKFGEVKNFNGPAPTAGSVLSGLAQSPLQGLRSAREGMRLQMADTLEALGVLRLSPEAKKQQMRQLAQAQGAAGFTTPDFESSTAQAVYGGAASTLRMLPGLAATVATRSTVPLLASAGIQTEAEAYGKYRLRDATPVEAAIGALAEGGIEVATELLPSKFLADAFGRAGVREFISGLLAREIPGEQIATLLQDAVDTAVANPNKTWADYLNERPDAAYQTLVSTLTQSAVMGGASRTMRALAGDQARVEKAQEHASVLTELFQKAAESKLRERNPETFAQFVQQAGEAKGLNEVYIDVTTLGNVLEQSGVTPEQLAELLPSVAPQLEAAAAAGGVIAIPLGEAAAALPGTPLEQAFLQNLRTDPEGLSQIEAEQAAQQAADTLRTEADRVLGEAADGQAAADSADRVRQTVLDQLNATKRFTPDVHEAYATLVRDLYVAVSGRAGKTPEELYAEFPLRIGVQSVAGDALNQNADVNRGADAAGTTGESAAGGNTQSAPIDEATGLPLNADGTVTVYHHTSAASADAIRNSGTLKADAEPDVYVTTRQQTDTGYGDTAVPIRVRPDQLQLDDEFPDGRRDFRLSVGKPGGSIEVSVQNESSAPEGTGALSPELLAAIDDKAAGAAATLLELGKDESLYQYPKSAATDLVQVAADKNPALQVEPDTITQMDGSEKPTGTYSVTTPKGQKASITEKDGKVWINVAALTEGGEGSLVYDLAANYALNTKQVFIGDPDGLSDAAMRRRLENMISSAVKYGTTDHLAPHPRQLVGSTDLALPPLPWKDGDTLRNLQGMIRASVATNEHNQPIGTALEYDGQTDSFRDGAGNVVGASAEVFTELARADARVPGDGAAGRTTLQRTALFAALLRRPEGRRALLENLRQQQSDGGTGPGRTFAESFYQGGVAARGVFSPDTNTIVLLKDANLTTFLHELGHFYLEMLSDLASRPNAPPALVADMQTLLDWFGIKGDTVPAATGSGPLQQTADDDDVDPWVGHKNEPPPAAARAVDLRAMAEMAYWSQVGGQMLRAPLEDGQGMDAPVTGRTPWIPAEAWFGAMREQLAKGGLSKQAEIKAAVEKAIAGEKLNAREKRTVDWMRAEVERMRAEFDPFALSDADELAADAFQEGLSAVDAPDAALLARAVEIDESAVEDAARLHENDDAAFIAAIKGIVDGDQQTQAAGDPSRGPDAGGAQASGAREAAQPAAEQAPAVERSALEVWRTLSLDQRRAYHERFAESFEQYLIEGKAPSQELRSLFSRFRSWLTTIYKSLTQFMRGRNLQLSQEVRAVFDRMLATDEQIAEAERLAGYVAVYKSAEEAGVTAEEWEQYQALHAAGTSEAIAQLQARSLRDLKWTLNARSKELKRLQAEVADLRKAAREQALIDVRQQPVYAAQRWLKTGLMPDGTQTEGAKLNTATLREICGDGPASPWRYLATNMLSADPAKSVHPDVVAEMFGYTSGDQMVRAIVEAFPEAQAVDGLADQRLLEEHGEMVTPEGIKRAANEAVHNEARARAVATELAMLAKSGNARVMLKAAKQFAENIVARSKVRDLKPGKFTGAESRAARAATKALASGDTAAAVRAKQDQLLNGQTARLVLKAQDEVQRGVEYLRKFDKASIRSKLPPEYLDQIDKLLERFELRQVSQRALDKRASLAAWVESQRAIGVEPDIPPELLAEAGLLSYRELTMEQFRGLLDTVKNIEHLGRLKDRLLTAKEQRAFEAVRDELADSITSNAGDRQADTRTPASTLGRFLQGMRNFGAAHIKAATWARIFDGGKDGGPVWEYFIRPANERADWEATRRADATLALSRILEPWIKGGKLGGSGTYFASVDRSLNREQVLAIALNTGNEGNLQRLLGGEGWSLQQLQPVLATLSPQDWQTVQQVWDYFESFKPEIGAKEQRVQGKQPQWVEAGSPVTRALNIKGGYYPIKYDPAASVRAEENADAEGAKRQLQGAYGAATTRRSFTKTRAEEVSGRPLLYTLGGVYSGVNDVIHDLAWHEWLIDMNRLLRSQKIDSAIREHYGPAAVRQLKEWRDRIAEGDQGPAHAGEVALGKLRQSVSVAGLGFNVMSALMQPLGLTQSIVRIGPQWVGKGIAAYSANPKRATAEVKDKSEFMRNRTRTRFRELDELRNRVQGQTAAKTAIQQGAYFMMLQVQQMVDVPTWLGAYEKAIAAGNADDRAIDLADQAVIDAQGGGQGKDLSAIESGGPALRLFTVFYTFMNTALNLGVASKMTPRSKAKFAADMLLLYTVPAVLSTLFKDAITPGDAGDDDEEELARKLIAEQLTFLMGLFVVGREFAAAGKTMVGEGGRDYQGPAGLRVISDTGSFAKQAAQGEFDDSFRKSAINLVGGIAGLPAAQINRSITGAQALAEGETQNPAALLFGYQEPR